MNAKERAMQDVKIDYDAMFLEMVERRYQKMAEESLRRAEERRYEALLEQQYLVQIEREDLYNANGF